VPAYIQSQEFMHRVATTVTQSELSAGKKIVFFITRNAETKNLNSKELSERYNCHFILNDSYVNENTFKIIQSLGEKIHVCSGDKSLEEAFALGRIPFYQVKDNKKDFYTDLINIIKNISVDENMQKAKNDLCEFLSAQINNEDVGKSLTEAAYQFWSKVCIPYFKDHHNYSRKVAEIEKESIMLYEILKSDDKQLIAKNVEYFSKKLDINELLNTLLIAATYNSVAVSYHGGDRHYLNFIDNYLLNLPAETCNQLINHLLDNKVQYNMSLSMIMRTEENLIIKLLFKTDPDPISLFKKLLPIRESSAINILLTILEIDEKADLQSILKQSGLSQSSLESLYVNFKFSYERMEYGSDSPQAKILEALHSIAKENIIESDDEHQINNSDTEDTTANKDLDYIDNSYSDDEDTSHYSPTFKFSNSEKPLTEEKQQQNPNDLPPPKVK